MISLKYTDICRYGYQQHNQRCIRGWAIHLIQDHPTRMEFFYILNDLIRKRRKSFDCRFDSKARLASINDLCESVNDRQQLADCFNLALVKLGELK